MEWIELYNRSATDTVDLTGWELSEAVQFGFPAGTSLAPEEYLLVANDADAVAYKYPAVNNIVGSFSGGLSNHNEQIQLLDELGNPADEVHYYQSGRWPADADGGGRTLELRDPFADNSRPEVWAASDESGNSNWLTYSYSGVVVADTYSSVSTRYQEFILGMLDGGEILLDDISLIEQPSTQRIQRLQNGRFESDTVGQSPANWRIGGTHQGVVINDPDNPSNQVLYLKATAVMEDRYNHAETTLAGGAMIRNNIEYEISFRAKWLGGSNQLNTHLYYNRLPRTTLLAVPDATGTPGVVNSVFAGNIGPTYRDMVHNPVVPSAMESVTVSILAEDLQDVAIMKLKYAVAGGAFQSVNMNDVGGGRYEGNVPAQSASSIVQFYVKGVDSQGAVSTFPAAGAESRALYKVQDNQARTGSQIHNFRIIMTSDDADMMFDPTKIMSNGRIGSTVIYNESEVFYDVGTRAAGSNAARGEINAARINFNVQFDSMRLFRGVHRTVAIDRSGHGMVRDSQDEILMKHIGNRAGNIPYQYDDLTYFIAPQSQFNRPAQLLLARQSDVFLDSQFDNGSEGTVFKFDIPYVPNNTDGGSEGSKLPSPYSHPRPDMDLQDLGDDKEFYRAHYYIRNNRRQDDYTQIINMAKTFELTGTALEVAAYDVIDVDQWTRTFALLSLIGCLDAITQHISNHNIKFYVRPSDHKVLALPWDWDYAYRQPTSSPLIGASGNSSRTTQFLNRPSIRRMVHGHLLDIINTSFNNAYMNSWIDHYGDVAGQEYGPIKTFISNRRSYVLNHLPTQFSFEIDTNGRGNFSTSNTVIELVGQGWMDVQEIRLAGSAEPLAVRWVNERDWKLTLPVTFGNNHFQFEAYNHQGQLVGADSIVVTGQSGTPTLRNSLRITELNYNPYDPTAAELAVDSILSSNDFEFIEIQNIAAQTIDVTTVQITDGIEFAFSPTQLAAGQRAVIVRDAAAFELRYGMGINVLGEFSSGGLNGNGERITLVDGALNTVLDFAYNDNDPWPIRADGHGATLELVNPSQTPSDQFGKYYHWRGSTEKGGTPGAAGQGPVGVVINELLSHTDVPIVETDSIELVNTLASPIDIGGWFLSDAANNFLKYRIPESTVLDAGQYVVFDESHFNPTPATPGANHFALNGLQGDDVWLVDPNGPGGTLLFVDDVHFDATVNGESLGRVPDRLGRIAPNVSLTLGRQNSKSRVGPIVISEFNYNPGFPTAADLSIDPNFQIDHLQWIEIFNPSGQTVDLSHWRLRGGADYDFPAGTSIGAGATLTVVSFDPSSVANTDRVAAFRSHYEIDTGVKLVGGFQGQLDKGADRISLQRALASPAEDSTFVPRAIEDEVVYDNLSPWPITSAGGISLNRNSAAAAGNDATNWSSDSPTPGLFTGSLLGDFNGDHLVNAMDIDLLFAEINKGTHPPIFDLTGDMQVTRADTDQLVQVILMSNYGDTDLDQDVDTGDLTNAIINFTSAGGTGKTWEDGDGDGDGDVDTGDLTTAIINFSGAAAAGLLTASSEVIVLPAVADDPWQPEEPLTGRLLTADAELLTTPDGGADPASQVELPKSNVQHGVFNGSTKRHSADDDAETEKANDTLPVEPLELETGVFQLKTWPGRSSR